MSLQRLRTQSLFDGYDQLTPGMGAGMDYMEEDSNPTSPYTPGPQSSGLQQVGAQQDRDAVLGPDGRPLESNIQAPTVDPISAPTPKRPTGPTLKETIDAMNAGYTPDYTSRDRLNVLLNEAPERKAPGWGRALVAAGMSIKAQDPIATAEKVMYAPYMRDIEEWKTKAEPYYKAADLENRQNVNERTLVANAATAYSTAERNRIAQENNEAKNEAAMVRARAYQAKNSGLTIIKAGDRLVGIDPTTHQRVDLGSSGGMSVEDLANLQGEWGVKKAEASGAAAVERARASGGQVYETPDGPRRYNPNDPNTPATPVPGLPKGSTKIGTDRASSTNTLERRRIEQDAMKDHWTGDNSVARRYMTPDGKGGYNWKNRPEITPENTWWPGTQEVTQADQQAYDTFRKSVDPDWNPPPAGKGLSPSGTPEPANKRPIIGGSNTPIDQDGNPKAGPRNSAPDITSPSKDITAPQQTTGRDYRLKQNPNNPNEKVRSFDGGKTWQKSTDGGRTWR